MSFFPVRIVCRTYNQEEYILDAINGFVEQETSFDYVAAIIDDASSDCTATLINNYITNECDLQSRLTYETDYASIIISRHKSNKCCTLAAFLLKYNHFSIRKSIYPYLDKWLGVSKYNAICEGDDYWICSEKLQKQYDFLEHNPEFSMCCHGADILNLTSIPVECRCEELTTREYTISDAFPEWKIPTASIFYNRAKVNSYHISNGHLFKAGDVVLILRCMYTGKVWGFEDHMSVYRVNNQGLTRKEVKDDDIKRMCSHYKALMLNFPDIDKKFCKNYIASYHYTHFRQEKKTLDKISNLYYAIRYSPRYVLKKVYAALLK